MTTVYTLPVSLVEAIASFKIPIFLFITITRGNCKSELVWTFELMYQIKPLVYYGKPLILCVSKDGGVILQSFLLRVYKINLSHTNLPNIMNLLHIKQ